MFTHRLAINVTFCDRLDRISLPGGESRAERTEREKSARDQFLVCLKKRSMRVLDARVVRTFAKTKSSERSLLKESRCSYLVHFQNMR